MPQRPTTHDRLAAASPFALRRTGEDGWAAWCEHHPQPMWLHQAGDGIILRTNAALRNLVGDLPMDDVGAILRPVDGRHRRSSTPDAPGSAGVEGAGSSEAGHDGLRPGPSMRGLERLLGTRPDLSPLVSGWALRTPTGQLDVELLIVPAPEPEGALHVTVRGAVEANLATRALAESEARFRQLSRNVPGAIFQYMLRPDGTDHVLFMSEGCHELWEVSADEVVQNATALWEVCHPDDIDALRASVLRSAETLEPWIHAWRIVTPTGRMKWLQSNGRPRRLDDGSILWDSYIFDVTASQEAIEAKGRLEEELQQARHLEALGRLAGGVAHDFNNLLTVILANAEEVAEQNPLAAGEAADIVDAAQRAAALTRQLLTFARRQPVIPEVVRVGEHIGGSTRLFERLAKGADLSLSIASVWTVRIDPTQLDQILTNLIANAREATGPRGRITVSVRDAAPRPTGEAPSATPGVAEREHVRILVEDNGRGMKPETLHHIFDPFFTTRKDRGGTGLGLATVYGIVTQNRGHIAVDSTPGRGTSFQVLLPRYAGMAPARQATLPRVPLVGRRALLVEDEPGVRHLVTIRLRRLGLGVTPVESAEDALAWLATEDARSGLDLLVTDLALPGLRGQELTDRVRARYPDVAVVAMSGYHDVRWDGPPPTLLPKPFDADSLERAVRTALESGRGPADPHIFDGLTETTS